MSASIWGEPDLHSKETYPLALLTELSRQAMQHFGAQGACLALYDEDCSQMRVQIHIRVKNSAPPLSERAEPSLDQLPRRRAIVQLEGEEQATLALPKMAQASPLAALRRQPQSAWRRELLRPSGPQSHGPLRHACDLPCVRAAVGRPRACAK